jgi:uncharacterized membrane protein (UPF0127 family)
MASPTRSRPCVGAVVLVSVLGLALPGCGDGASPPAVTDGDTAVPGDDPTTVATAPPTAAPTFGTEADQWPATTVELTAADGSTEVVRVRVAATPAQRRQGLMRVESLAPGTGMLFDFGGEERDGGFWMLDTPVPLELAYIRDGEIVTIRQMEPCVDYEDPMECPAYPPDGTYDTALEVPQGWFEEHGITEGSRVEVSPS